MEATLEGSVFSLTLKRTMCSMALDLVDIILTVDLNGEERRWRVRCFGEVDGDEEMRNGKERCGFKHSIVCSGKW